MEGRNDSVLVELEMQVERQSAERINLLLNSFARELSADIDIAEETVNLYSWRIYFECDNSHKNAIAFLAKVTSEFSCIKITVEQF